MRREGEVEEEGRGEFKDWLAKGGEKGTRQEGPWGRGVCGCLSPFILFYIYFSCASYNNNNNNIKHSVNTEHICFIK